MNYKEKLNSEVNLKKKKKFNFSKLCVPRGVVCFIFIRHSRSIYTFELCLISSSREDCIGILSESETLNYSP